MSTQDYHQQSIQKNYEKALHDQNHQQPCGMQNCQGEYESQVEEFTFLKELLFLIYHCITFGNFELDEIKCSWIVTIFSNITIAILLAIVSRRFKFDYEYCYEILNTLIFLILSGIVKIFLFLPLPFVNAFAITPFFIFKEIFFIIIVYSVFDYFDISENKYNNAIALSIIIEISFISFIRIIFKTQKFLSKKRIAVSIILSLVVCIAERLAILWIFE